MNGARDQFFPGAGFSRDQDRGIGGRDPRNPLACFPDGGAVAIEVPASFHAADGVA